MSGKREINFLVFSIYALMSKQLHQHHCLFKGDDSIVTSIYLLSFLKETL